ncbi:MAG: hypothetical protein OQK24_13530, partial [Magnetovibrio sp.]|nr:hypothetical protein [Magnetovibrio sp.]
MSDLILDGNAPANPNAQDDKPALDLGPKATPTAGTNAKADLVIDSNTANFARDVIEASVQVPVI